MGWIEIVVVVLVPFPFFRIICTIQKQQQTVGHQFQSLPYTKASTTTINHQLHRIISIYRVQKDQHSMDKSLNNLHALRR
jgi:hypothetical protein